MDRKSILAYFLVLIKNNEISLALSSEHIKGLVAGLQAAIKHEVQRVIDVLLPVWPSDQAQRDIGDASMAVNTYRNIMGALLELDAQFAKAPPEHYLYVLSEQIQKSLEEAYGDRAKKRTPFDNIILYVLPGKDAVTIAETNHSTTGPEATGQATSSEQSQDPGHIPDGTAAEGISGIPETIDHIVSTHEDCCDKSTPISGQV